MLYVVKVVDVVEAIGVVDEVMPAAEQISANVEDVHSQKKMLTPLYFNISVTFL